MDEKKPTPRPPELQRQLDQIGDRFVQRLLSELAMMRELIADVKAGDSAGLKELELFAHRIHGSSAMFGFDRLAETSGELEKIVARRSQTQSGTGEDIAQIEEAFASLEAAGRAAAASRSGS